MSTASATPVIPEAFAAQAVSATARLLSYSESIRLRSSLVIDLDLNPEAVGRAVDRAVRGIESHRLGYRSRLSPAEAAEIAELRAVLEAVAA